MLKTDVVRILSSALQKGAEAYQPYPDKDTSDAVLTGTGSDYTGDSSLQSFVPSFGIIQRKHCVSASCHFFFHAGNVLYLSESHDVLTEKGHYSDFHCKLKIGIGNCFKTSWSQMVQRKAIRSN